MKEFPIPVVSIGPGSHEEDENLDYLPMPTDMATFSPPLLPEREDMVGHEAARQALQAVKVLLQHCVATGEPGRLELGRLEPADLKLVNQVMGEGEASAIIHSRGDSVKEVRVQESVFAGIWRLLTFTDGQLSSDVIEVGPVPALFAETAAQDVQPMLPRWPGALPPNVQNAPLLVEEIQDKVKTWKRGQDPYVVNFSLLPVSDEDIGFVDHHLGTGRVLILSRGYGNCRISNTCLPNCWRVVYYNSMDKVILNTVEVVDMPEVAKAAPEDLQDSLERFDDVLLWLDPA